MVVELRSAFSHHLNLSLSSILQSQPSENQYRGGCSVPWGDIMSTVGGYHEYRGGIS